ncbi:lipoate--protein ligase family protein [Vagococcus intermedius]|uniref:Octanoyl-[GcvH]:protein N-octanoyltransferase n=1 Tax=Vagococcus intermedius TaxID=2991418 RepID=A0AAF0I5F2_9ENTE|nr:lipoate--protein ligase family protein [Vagococcus intermedius]WEG72943.1 lipoate--protein ligase family protein [Vagococcus intermedius]WEG75029.1 lipoate--protein ligase family protein [Vagococcus intermedius]
MMKTYQTLFKQSNSLLFNQPCVMQKDALTPFALTDVFIQYVATHNVPIFHFWQANQCVILGMKDTRVTNLPAGLNVFKTAGYHFLARNSGGLAVVADEGVLNFSIIIPNSTEEKITVPEAYDFMTNVIQRAFDDFTCTIEAKEISASYCPGDYDLSINNKKFAGISQRRIGTGIAIMIYLSVNGHQIERGQMVHDFYKQSLEEEFGNNGYPPVDPYSMANLSDLLQQDLSVEDVKKRITTVLTADFIQELSDQPLQTFIGQPTENESFQKHMAKMIKRNETILNDLEGVPL